MMRKHTFLTGVRSSESGVRSSEFLVLSSESGERRAETGKKSADGLLRKFGATTGVAIVSAAALATLFFAGCGRKPEGGPPGMGGGGPLEVSVLTVKPTSVMLTQDLPGRISAFRVAEVRARVNGIVLRRLFSEGSDVKEGQLLYEIDPAPYQAAFDSARGALARAEANVTTARLKEERYKQLLAAKAISKQDYDDAVANAGAFDADVISGKAALQTAQINLGYTKVTSPVAGRIGISQVTEGAYGRRARRICWRPCSNSIPCMWTLPRRAANFSA